MIVLDRTRTGKIVPTLLDVLTSVATPDPFLEWSIELDMKLFGRETPFLRIKLK